MTSTGTQNGRRLAAADRFVARITAACRRDAGAGQAVRSALGRTPAEAVRAHRYVAAQLPDDPAPDLEWAHYTVAALIALYEPRARPAKDRPAPEQDQDNDQEQDQGRPAGEPHTESERLRRGNLGAVLGALDIDELRKQDKTRDREAARAGEDPEGPSAVRLQRLIRDDLAGLHEDLPGVMRLACDGPRLPDWAVLLHDLASWEWNRHREATVLRWSTAYYKSLTRGAGVGAGADHESES